MSRLPLGEFGNDTANEAQRAFVQIPFPSVIRLLTRREASSHRSHRGILPGAVGPTVGANSFPLLVSWISDGCRVNSSGLIVVCQRPSLWHPAVLMEEMVQEVTGKSQVGVVQQFRKTEAMSEAPAPRPAKPWGWVSLAVQAYLRFDLAWANRLRLEQRDLEVLRDLPTGAGIILASNHADETEFKACFELARRCGRRFLYMKPGGVRGRRREGGLVAPAPRLFFRGARRPERPADQVPLPPADRSGVGAADSLARAASVPAYSR
jgi:hypothetical protein